LRKWTKLQFIQAVHFGTAELFFTYLRDDYLGESSEKECNQKNHHEQYNQYR
jgi:hypothetical protein